MIRQPRLGEQSVKNLHSLLVRHLPALIRKTHKKDWTDAQDFDVWKDICEQILAQPFPPQSSDFSRESLENDQRLVLAKLSNWEIICQEILDTEHSHIYYQKCYEELRSRGKSEREIFEMRRVAWYTAGWLNFPMMAWNWVSLDEGDILKALKELSDEGQITQTQRIELEDFVKLHAG